jgi:hypothetical protein
MSASVLDFAPLIPAWLLILLSALALGAAGLGAALRLSGWLWRAVAALGLALILANPSLVEENREILPDIAVFVDDSSASMATGERADAVEALRHAMRDSADADPTLELVEVEARGNADGTQVFDAVAAGLANLPADRVAAVVLASDGQIHDAPADAAALGLDAPLHHVVIGDRDAGDRRLVIEEAPRYGIVGQTAEFIVRVEDEAVDGSAIVSFRFQGGAAQRHRVPIGRDTAVSVPVQTRGPNVIEIEVEAGPQELSLVNNRAAASISGVRDRLRVLLVTGEPHNGARAWRDLLKSDPSVELIHFTILRPPSKQDGTPQDELSLIEFPTRRLFDEELSGFDLVIFDRYRRRQQEILSLYYLDRVARYVEDGGALLMTAGPPFAGPASLHRTPLSLVLPVRPTGEVVEGAFRPQPTRDGLRHPVTQGLSATGANPDWGRWFRHIPTNRIDGRTLLEAPGGAPLLVLDREQDPRGETEGRIAMVMSDQTWLWARGYDGGGPYAEMFRRVAHWLMQEPELDEERLHAAVSAERLVVERVTLAEAPPPLQIEWPDGRVEQATMSEAEPGRFRAALPADGAGMVRFRSGQLTTVAALGPLNPLEYADMRPTDAVTRPAVDASGGTLIFAGEGAGLNLPALRRVRAGSEQAGRRWLGLQRNERYRVLGATRLSLLPALPAAILLTLLLGAIWWREGR